MFNFHAQGLGAGNIALHVVCAITTLLGSNVVSDAPDKITLVVVVFLHGEGQLDGLAKNLRVAKYEVHFLQRPTFRFRIAKVHDRNRSSVENSEDHICTPPDVVERDRRDHDDHEVHDPVS